MTLEQKQRINELRQSGLGHRKIAAQIGISENTVKGYIRRNGITPKTENTTENAEGFCQQCGTDLSDVDGRKGQKFCSEPCRRAWYSCVCAGCGKEFKSYGNEKRKYCGHDCYIAYRFYKGVMV